MTIDERVTKYTEEHSLSDRHFHAGKPFAIREGGEITTFSEELIGEEELSKFIHTHLESDEMRDAFAREREADLAIVIEGRRYRRDFSILYMGQGCGMKSIEAEIASMNALDLPQVVQEMANQPNGLR